MIRTLRYSCFVILVCVISFYTKTITAQTDPNHPNVLLIIADDLGVDASNGYLQSPRMPVTPHLDSLRGAGVTFKNTWATPECTPTRATIMSGKYGVKTGVLEAPGNLDTTHISIFKELETQTGGVYADAVIGKWHISQPQDNLHPEQHGVDHYEGVFSSGVSNYYNWDKITYTTVNGATVPVSSTETEYATSNLTTAAINWINTQNQPWLMWLAHVAPHGPYHVPPANMYTSTQTNSNLQKYITMIEALDYDIGRLLDNIPTAVKNNTVVIYIGDNGGGGAVSQLFQSTHDKGTLYQGGVHVPLIVSGAGVNRVGEEEQALVQATDIYATILEIAGANLPGGMYNSKSFKDLLNTSGGATRPYNYTEILSQNVEGWTIRDSQYKLIEYADGTQEFYDLVADTFELTDLISVGLTTAQTDIKTAMEEEAYYIRNGWSCQDLIQNGSEEMTDCGGSSCWPCPNSLVDAECKGDSIIICSDIALDSFLYAANYISSAYQLNGNAVFEAGQAIDLEAGFCLPLGNQFLANIDNCVTSGIDDTNCPNDNSTSYTNIGCCVTPSVANVYTETVANDIRTIDTNNFPNHDYCHTQNNIPSPSNKTFSMDATPVLANSPTSILSPTGNPAYFYGIALNGVLLAPAPAAPFIFENTNTGQYNWDWVFEPINNQGQGAGKVSLDCASAHTGPQGYHYHGNMFEYAELLQAGISTATTAPSNPVVIGWAADGFPILYRFAPDGTGSLALLQPSYQIKYGLRPGNGITAPCGEYNGKYTNDYEYVACLGDLDECNGIQRNVTITTAQGMETFNYFYVVTDEFPQIGRCLWGTPDPSFD